MITVGAIDDDVMFIRLMASYLSSVGDISLIATDSSVIGYLAKGARADIVLLDINLPDGSQASENVACLRADGSKVLVVSIHSEPAYIIATLEAGAEGYLVKGDDGPEELTESIRRAHAGLLVPSQELAFAISRDHRPGRPRLSPQEQRLFVLYARGMTLADASARIGVSTRTGEDYLNRIKRKYADVGRPAHTKLELHQRLSEDESAHGGSMDA